MTSYLQAQSMKYHGQHDRLESPRHCAAFAMPAAVLRHVAFRRRGGASVAAGNEAIGTVNRIYTKEEITRKVASCLSKKEEIARKVASCLSKKEKIA
ncbi:MAG: hypothetical protein LBJ23_06390, partial [Tannerella sp.]|nr:hypothetical protein [Tannerella sp.]